jgi:hypothetical protein
MQTIRATCVPAVIKDYPSAAEAIEASQQEWMSWTENSGIAPLIGQKIKDAWWDELAVSIRLSAGDVIQIRCHESGVICELVGSNNLATRGQRETDDNVELILGPSTVRWDRNHFIEELAGRTLLRIQPSSGCLFFYARGLPIICFGVLRNLDTGNLFLFWDESD